MSGSRGRQRASGMPPVLYVVVPCYNEQDALPRTARALSDALTSCPDISPKSRVLLVDDGSSDKTWETIVSLSEDPAFGSLFTGISLAHNRGHQAALLAGLTEALERGCDCAISMDADLQDDPAVIPQMLTEYDRGAEIVFGVRSDRETDTRFKRGTARAFYRLMAHLGVELVADSADCRLMGRRALAALSEYEEENLFLRGIVPSLGFRTAEVRYERAPRVAGESKYPLSKMVAFALEGITSFSTVPIRLVALSGVLFLVVAVAMLIWAIVASFLGVTVPGWSSLMVSLWFIGGAVMLSLGIVGEYVGKCYLEAKRRPRWHVAERLP